MRLTRTLAVISASVAATASLAAGVIAAPDAMAGATSYSAWSHRSAANAAANQAALIAAADDLTVQAIAVGAISAPPDYTSPVDQIYADVVALTEMARSQDPTLTPQDTTAVMGAVPAVLQNKLAKAPWHRHITATHTLDRWDGHSVAEHPSAGWGLHRDHLGNRPAQFHKPNGTTVEPNVHTVTDPTVGETAIRAALERLGLPYVWAASGPVTFDCSGLTMWAYAKAGIALRHYTGWQWNEGAKIPPSDILPGDLVLFGNPTHHVGIYLGAGWMVNAPYTGQYVNVVPVESGVAGVIRP